MMKKKIQPKNNVAENESAIGDNWKTTGKLLEKENDYRGAIHLYENALKRFPSASYIYDRLMMLYRKEKSYRKELTIIIKAIKAFTILYTSGKSRYSARITSLSKSILHAVGLTNRKGKLLYMPQPIARWEKRKQIVQQKLSRR